MLLTRDEMGFDFGGAKFDREKDRDLLAWIASQFLYGEVTGIHLRDDCLRDGRFDATLFQPLGRMGYRDYVHVTEVFELIRPDD